MSISTKPEITLGVRVPRAGYIRFPLGNPVGEPFNDELGRQILVDLTTVLTDAIEPGGVYQLPYRWRRGRIDGA